MLLIFSGRGWNVNDLGNNEHYYLYIGLWNYMLSSHYIGSDGHARVINVISDGSVDGRWVDSSDGGVQKFTYICYNLY